MGAGSVNVLGGWYNTQMRPRIIKDHWPNYWALVILSQARLSSLIWSNWSSITVN